jgi:plastocyanin
LVSNAKWLSMRRKYRGLICISLEETRMRKFTTLTLLAACLISAGVTHAAGPVITPSPAQIVALDECDPATFNDPAAAGPGFCLNVALGASTIFANLLAEAAAGTPDPNWNFQPSLMTIKKGGLVSVVDEGGEPHTFTEVAQFGGGFIPGLNAPGEDTVPECSGGFSNLAVAKTRILQGSEVKVAALSKGTHHFQCCIHPWMRVTVDVK